MPRLRTTLALLVTTAALLGQNCPERSLGVALGGGDDVLFGIRSIGFAFPFAGTAYTDVHICTNGFVYLSNGGVPAPGTADFSATTGELIAGPPRLCALWTDLNIVVANGASVWIDSTPARCTITWDQASSFGNVIEFQIQAQLFPSGEVRFFYGPGVINASTYSTAAAVGITGASPGLGAALPPQSDLSLGGFTLDNTVYERFVGGAFDMPSARLDLSAQSPGWLYANLPFSGCADAATYGNGCIEADDSFYELLPASGFDLSGKVITMLRQSSGYLVGDFLPGGLVPPGPGAVTVAAGDDVIQTVGLSAAMPVAGGTTSALTVCSNGHIALASLGNGTSIGPTIPVFLNWAQTAVGCIHDFDPTAPGSGPITFEEAGGIAYVTWNQVISWNTTSADTMQFQFNLTTGDITIVFDVFQPAGNNYLVGYSVGGPSPDPGPSDVSTAFATATLLADVPVGPGLALVVEGLPYLGSNSFLLETRNVPNVLPAAVTFFGTGAVPGIDLGFLGAAGCRLYTTADLGSLTFPVPLPAGTGGFVLAVPSSPGLLGIAMTCQSAALTLANQLGLVTSNGARFTVGY